MPALLLTIAVIRKKRDSSKGLFPPVIPKRSIGDEQSEKADKQPEIEDKEPAADVTPS
ncbi:hypothetical protein D3C84_1277460 [compost metagenome]